MNMKSHDPDLIVRIAIIDLEKRHRLSRSESVVLLADGTAITMDRDAARKLLVRERLTLISSPELLRLRGRYRAPVDIDALSPTPAESHRVRAWQAVARMQSRLRRRASPAAWAWWVMVCRRYRCDPAPPRQALTDLLRLHPAVDRDLLGDLAAVVGDGDLSSAAWLDAVRRRIDRR